MSEKKYRLLKPVQCGLRAVQCLCSVIILAIYSYILAALSNRKLNIKASARAVEGISGVAVFYTSVSIVMLLCVPIRTVVAFTAMVFDFMFAVAFIYVAAANGDGADSCSGEVNTQFGKGNSSSEVDSEGNGGFANLPTYGQACQLEAAVLGVSIIALFFFVFSLVIQLAIGRQHWRHKRDNRILPDPNGPMGPGGVHLGSSVNEKPDLLGPGGNANKNTAGGWFLSRLLGKKNVARTSSDGENMLPRHPSPTDVEQHPSGDSPPLRNGSTNAGETYIFSQDVTAPGPTTHPLDQTSGYMASSPYEGATYSHTYTHAVSPVSIGNMREPRYEPYSAHLDSPGMNAHLSSGALDYDTYRQTDARPPTYRPYGDGTYDRVQDRML